MKRIKKLVALVIVFVMTFIVWSVTQLIVVANENRHSIIAHMSVLHDNEYHESVVFGANLTVEISIDNQTPKSLRPIPIIAGFNDGRFVRHNTLSPLCVPAYRLSNFSFDVQMPTSDIDTINIMLWDNFGNMNPIVMNVALATGNGTDFFGNDFNSAYTINPARAINGRINTPNDLDFFRFTAPSTGEFIIAIQSQQALTGRLYDNNRELLNENTVIATQGGTYLVGSFKAGATYYLRMSGSVVGDYRIRILPMTNRAQNLVLDVGRTGTITSDTDYFKYTFIAPTDGVYIFTSVGSTEVKGILHNSSNPTLGAIFCGARDNADNVSFRIKKELSAGETISLIITSKSDTSFGMYSLFVERELTVIVN